MSAEWYADHYEILRLLRWLHEHEEHGPLEIEHVFDVLEKPWHWDEEYSTMVREQMATGERKDEDIIARGEDAADLEEQR